ncbi:MAG: hypothetical protein GX568_09105, partial [Candidatus Gastranaerophilales bacterium]|nr:hypothetical protein [Candidatus Gastranaerophilales bacterium]
MKKFVICLFLAVYLSLTTGIWAVSACSGLLSPKCNKIECSCCHTKVECQCTVETQPQSDLLVQVSPNFHYSLKLLEEITVAYNPKPELIEINDIEYHKIRPKP